MTELPVPEGRFSVAARDRQAPSLPPRQHTIRRRWLPRTGSVCFLAPKLVAGTLARDDLRRTSVPRGL